MSTGVQEDGDEDSQNLSVSYGSRGEHTQPSDRSEEERGRVIAPTVQNEATGKQAMGAFSSGASKTDEEPTRSRLQAISLSNEHGGAPKTSRYLSSAKEEPDVYAATSSPAPKDPNYVDPTPKTPRPSAPPSRAPSSSAPASREVLGSGIQEELGGGYLVPQSDMDVEERGMDDSKSEIQSIMDQFDGEGSADDSTRVISSRLEFGDPLLGGAIQHPPRKSSLEPSKSDVHSIHPVTGHGTKTRSSYMDDMSQLQEESHQQHENEKSSDPGNDPPGPTMHSAGEPNIQSPQSPASLSKPPPPEPDPEPDLPFDFHRFLEQLRHKTADPVAKFLRSFLAEFGKKQWMVHEQVKIISDFLAFITNKMAQCEIWRGVSDAEFDNAKEGMEKLVMNRLYSQTFSPAIPPPPAPNYATKGKRKNPEKLMGPGRRGQHQEDIERDEILGQKVRIYGWVEEQHLDIPPVGPGGRRFLILAQQGILFPFLLCTVLTRSRAAKDQNISSATRQSNLRIELL